MQWFRGLRFGLAQRTMLLLVAAVSGSLVVLAVGFAMQRQNDFTEFADARARSIAAQVHSIRLVLLSVPAANRPQVSEGLLASGTLYAFPADEIVPPELKVPAPQPSSRDSLLASLFGGSSPSSQDISEAIGRYAQQPAEVRHTTEPGASYWVSQEIDGVLWWIVVLAGGLPPAPDGVPWPLVATVLLALLGVAAMFAATISRPLRELAAATHRIGDTLPEPVNVEGPAELRDLVASFNSMLVRLQQIEDERRVLLGGLPHDLRAPLTRLRLRLATLTGLGEHPGIVDDIESIDRIVRQFTDFLRGAQQDEPLWALDRIVHSVVDAYRTTGQDVRVEGDLDLDVPVPQFAVSRILDNLIGNAVQHGRGPVLLRVASTEPGFVDLSVTDHGEGIPAGTAELALQPFTKLDAARGRGGCGLGLAIVRQLARRMGGGIRFEKTADSFSVLVRLGVQ